MKATASWMAGFAIVVTSFCDPNEAGVVPADVSWMIARSSGLSPWVTPPMKVCQRFSPACQYGSSSQARPVVVPPYVAVPMVAGSWTGAGAAGAGGRPVETCVGPSVGVALGDGLGLSV